MKYFNIIIAAAIISTSLVTSKSAQADYSEFSSDVVGAWSKVGSRNGTRAYSGYMQTQNVAIGNQDGTEAVLAISCMRGNSAPNITIIQKFTPDDGLLSYGTNSMIDDQVLFNGNVTELAKGIHGLHTPDFQSMYMLKSMSESNQVIVSLIKNTATIEYKFNTDGIKDAYYLACVVGGVSFSFMESWYR